MIGPRNLAAIVACALVGCAEPPETVELPPIEVSDAGASDLATAEDMAEPELEFVNGTMALDLVNPMIGTSGVGFAYAGMTPAVQVPLGFMRVGPDTTRGGAHSEAFYHFSGYYFDDPHLRGFSHTHFVGTGTADYGNLRIAFAASDRLTRAPRAWWLSKLDGSEVAEPGYYSVETEEGLRAELTATDHAAIHRYQVPRELFMAVDPAASVDDNNIIAADAAYADGHVTGQLEYKGDYVGRHRGFTLYYDIEVSPPPVETLVWDGAEFVPGAEVSSDEAALAMRWDADTEVTLRVGISLVKPENASRRVAGLADETFESVRDATRARWAEKLDRVQVAGGTEKQREIFYTALYNSFRMPSRLDEYGEYPGFDGEVHAVDHAYYSDLSLWDTYRTLHPLWTLIARDETRDVLNSLLLMGRDGGYIPRWPAAVSYTNGMEGDSATMLFAEAAVKGIDGVDYRTAFEMLKLTADAPVPDGAPYGGREGIEEFINLGWIPTELYSSAASNTLEYSVDDNALAVLAAYLGEDAEAARFADRAKNYKNVWDPQTRFFLPRAADGSFEDPFSVTKFNDRSGVFAEGSAWHYRFYATHDPDGLIELFGGAEAFTAELDTFMTESKLFDGNRGLLLLPDPYYWHTNQPPLHVPFLYLPAGRADLMTEWVAKILEFGYDTTPDGLVGNDDGGTLSAWYVLAATGLYPTVGTDLWTTFEPIFDGVRIQGATPAWPGTEPSIRTHAELWQP